MQARPAPTTMCESLMAQLNKMISKFTLSTPHTVAEPIRARHSIPDSQSAEAGHHPPTLPFDPTWSEEFHIALPTGADLTSWELYDLHSSHPPTALNHPIYSELPCWRRKSEGQYIMQISNARAGKTLMAENAALQERIRDLEIEGEMALEYQDHLKTKVWQMTKLNKLPRVKQVRRYLQLCHLYNVKKKDVQSLKEEVAGLEGKIEDWKVWCEGREEVISTLLAEKRELRERCCGLGVSLDEIDELGGEAAYFEMRAVHWEAFGRAEREQREREGQVIETLLRENEDLRVQCGVSA